MNEPIEPGHVMSREKYEAIHVQKIKDHLDAEMLKMLTHPVKPRCDSDRAWEVLRVTGA